MKKLKELSDKYRLEYVFLALIFSWFLFSLAPLPFVQISDGYFLWLPRLAHAAAEIKSGYIPFWNEFQFCGTTLLADGNTNFLNPVFFLYFFMQPSWAYTFGVIVLFFVLIMGAWFYFRERGLSKIPALAGTLGYGFGGQIIFWSLYHGMNLSLALFPWILFALRRKEKWNFAPAGQEKTFRCRKWRILAFSLVFVFAMGGFIQFTFIALIAVFLEGIESFDFQSIKKSFKERGLLLLLGLSSASCGILPTIESGILSHRKLIPYFEGLFPEIQPLWRMTFFGTSFGEHGYPNYFYYVGIIILALFFFYVRKDIKRIIFYPLFWYAVIFPFLIMAVCFKRLPLNFQFGVQSDPWRGMFVFIFFVSLCAAQGSELYFRELRNNNKLVFPPLEILLAGVILFFTLFCHKSSIISIEKGVIFVLAAAIWAGFILTVVMGQKKSEIRICIFSVWLIFLMAANSFSASKSYLSANVLHNPSYPWQRGPLPVEMLCGQGRVITLGNNRKYLEDWAVYHRIRSLGGYGSFIPKSIFMRTKEDGLFSWDFREPKHFKNNLKWSKDIMAKYGVLYLIDDRFLKDGEIKGWELAKVSNTTLIYKNPAYVGRAYLLDSRGNLSKGAGITKNTNSYVKISVEADEGETLILADSWFSGWQCYDNGRRVNGYDARGFRGYKIEDSGHHEVEWVYSPLSFWTGGVISVFSLGLFFSTAFRS